jgi:hypothetical protein
MKIIKYKFVIGEINHGTDEKPDIELILLDKEIKCGDAELEANLVIANTEAYNGEYTVDDDGTEEPGVTYTERIAEMEAALELLLSGVTE